MIRYCLNCKKRLVHPQKTFCSRSCAGKAVGALPKGQRLFSDDVYINDLVEAKNKLGRYPTTKEYLELGNFNPLMLYERFGSWIKALQLAGYKSPITPWTIDSITPEEGGWLAGFFAGEGTFYLARGKNSFITAVSITQRNDNPNPILEIIRMWKLTPHICHLRTNNKYNKKGTNYICNPVISLAINRASIIKERVLPTFMRYQLRSKKQDELVLFSEAVEIICMRLENGRFHLGYTDEELQRLITIKKQLEEMRKYQPPITPLNYSKEDRIKPFLYHMG